LRIVAGEINMERVDEQGDEEEQQTFDDYGDVEE
jgi:hypothetical protein